MMLFTLSMSNEVYAKMYKYSASYAHTHTLISLCFAPNPIQQSLSLTHVSDRPSRTHHTTSLTPPLSPPKQTTHPSKTHAHMHTHPPSASIPLNQMSQHHPKIPPKKNTNNNQKNTSHYNALSFSELCCLFCCPPCPGRIAAKLAFLPPEPTYELTEQLDDDEDEPPQQPSPPPSAKRPASGRKTAKAAAWTASIAAADAARAASLEARANANGRATTGKDKDGAAGVTTRNQADGKSKTSDATTTTTTPATNSPATAKKGHSTNNCSANNSAASTASSDKTASKTAAKKASTTKTKTATTTETAAASADKPKHARYKLKLFERAEWAYSDREKDKVEVFFAQTTRGNRIACMHIRCAPNARYTLLFSHGNAVDLGQMSSFYLGLGARINCNIFR